jgi:hypothetical protein
MNVNDLRWRTVLTRRYDFQAKKHDMKSFIAALTITLCTFVHAEGTFAADLDQLASGLRAVMAKAERAQQLDKKARNAIQDDSQKLLEKMIEISSQASRVHTELLKSGLSPDRELLLVASTADSMILALNLTWRYLDVPEKVFWTQALAAVAISKTLRAAAAK